MAGPLARASILGASLLLLTLAVAAAANPLPAGAVRCLGPMADAVNGLAFSRDGRTLTAWAQTKVLRWDVETGRPLGKGRQPQAVAAPDKATSPDGRFKAVITKDIPRVVHLTPAPNRKEGTYLPASTPRLRCLAFSPDSKVLLAGGEAGYVVAWDPATGVELFHTGLSQGGVTCLAFSPGGRLFATGDAVGCVLLWRLMECGSPLPAAMRDLPDERVLDMIENLGSDRGADAWYAVRSLWTVGDRFVPLLRDRLPARFDRKKVEAWLADLDADSFDRRERASAELAKLGPRIGPLLRRRLKDTRAPEARRRMRNLLEQLGDAAEDSRRWSRAVQALAQLNTPAAREVLRLLAEEDRIPAAADEAAAALRRP
jgi:hypothetical protein